MAALRTVLRPAPALPRKRLHASPHHRTFLSNPLALLSALTPTTTPPLQTLTARRTLPHPSAPIYSIIADIPSYPAFLPYLHASHITQWSAPDAEFGRRWPSKATLVAGFGGVREPFTSQVFCVPGRVVESVAGGAVTRLARGDVRHHCGEGEGEAEAERDKGEELLAHLRSTWTVEARGDAETEVRLTVEFAFRNPVYAALSAGAAPKVAEYMVAAFQKRVEDVLEGSPEMKRVGLGELEGSALKK